MSRLVHNPPGVDDSYLECLNTCFSGRWCTDSFRWYLKRPFGGRSPDIVALYEGDELAAGVGINYRQLNLQGHVSNVAILTAAWTLPRFRGRRHFSTLIRASEPIARDNGCVAILSFVTGHNASGRILRDCDAYAIPTWYISASAGQELRLPNTLPPVREKDSADGPFAQPDCGAVSFYYDSDVEWRAQFIFRAHPVVALEADKSEFILERVGDTDRLQYLSGDADDHANLAAIARNAQRNSRQLFCFTTSKGLAACAARMRMNVDAGNIMIIDLPEKVADERRTALRLRQAPEWKVQPGDRM